MNSKIKILLNSEYTNVCDIGELFFRIDESNFSPLLRELANTDEFEKYKSFFYSNEILSFLRQKLKRGCKLIFKDFREGCNIIQSKKHWYDYLRWLKKQGIVIIFKSNNLSVRYDDISHRANIYFLHQNNYDIKFIKSNFTKKFIFLNGSEKFYRTKLYEAFQEKNLLNEMYYSINSRHKNLIPHKILLDDIHLDNEFQFVNISKLNAQSFCNIITESSIDDIFLSEKIFKSLSSGEPFIVLGAVNYLSTLRKIGFKTFSNWWDESYDTESEFYLRLKRIQNIVLKISYKDMDTINKMYSEMYDTLLHNMQMIKYLKNMSEDGLETYINERLNT